MAQWIDWGNGHDGSPNAISGTVNTYASCTGTAGQTVLTTALSASAGDQILIHYTRHATEAGKWEVVGVASDAGATLNLTSALVNSYFAGAQCVLIPQYIGGTLSGAVTATAWNGSVGGIIALMCNGDLTISGSLSVNGGGFRGGIKDGGQNGGVPVIGYCGEGYSSGWTRQTGANTVGGGGGYENGATDAKPGGGGGGHATNGGVGVALRSPGIAGTGGGTAGNASLTSMIFGGSGGQSAYWWQTSASENPGEGGGIIVIIAKSFTNSGSIYSNGGSGSNSSAAGGACGGGAGGSIIIKTQVATLGSGTITANGGAAGVGDSNNGNAGTGSVGRIRCDYYTSVTGTTSPALSSAEDPSLNVPGNTGAFFQFL